MSHSEAESQRSRPKRRRKSQPQTRSKVAEILQPQPEKPSGWLGKLVYPVLALTFVAGGIGIYLFQGIQTYRYSEWTILPASDTRLEAACGELRLYYLGWQNPRTDQPIGHVVDTAKAEQCASSKTTPRPSDRFPGLKDKAVLAQLGCKPEGKSLEQAQAWTCTQPVGAKLRSEIEAANAQRNPSN